LERQRKKALKDFEKIKIEHGIATGNKKDEVKNIVFKDGELDEMEALRPKNGLPEIELFDYDAEEERDVNEIKLFVKRYSKLWKYLFYKYANSGFSSRSVNNFD